MIVVGFLETNVTVLSSCRCQCTATHTILIVHVWFGSRGDASVAPQHGWLEVGMTAGVFDQVVTAHEALVAQWALEAFFPRVRASVAGELIGAGKLLRTVRPDAREGPLPWTREAKE